MNAPCPAALNRASATRICAMEAEGCSDPSGLWVEVVEQIAPREGFWESYMVRG